MDRSTHALLSSSSAQSRLNVIQSSRNESETAVPAWISSVPPGQLTPTRNGGVNGNNLRTALPHGCSDDSGMHHQLAASGSFDTCFSKSPSQGSFGSNLTPSTFDSSPGLTRGTSPGCSTTAYSHDGDGALHRSLEALNFIPPIECARSVYRNEDVTDPETLLQSRVAVITPILTSCYTSQGGAALVAVEGLISMLNDTNFFAQDVADEGVDDIVESSTRLTLLDLSIQVVCDVATGAVRETYFRSCVDFVSDAVRYADGKLNDRTVGFVLRFYLFVFYFGASVPTTGGWPFNKEWHDSKAGIVNDLILLEHLEKGALTGGAPQAAAIALKEFVSIMLSHISTGMANPDDQLDNTDEGELSAQAENTMNFVQLAVCECS